MGVKWDTFFASYWDLRATFCQKRATYSRKMAVFSGFENGDVPFCADFEVVTHMCH